VSQAVKGERADARSIGSRYEFGGAAGRFGKIGAHLRGPCRLSILRHGVYAAGARDGSKPDTFFERTRH
jgi:hypothetical protein